MAAATLPDSLKLCAPGTSIRLIHCFMQFLFSTNEIMICENIELSSFLFYCFQPNNYDMSCLTNNSKRKICHRPISFITLLVEQGVHT